MIHTMAMPPQSPHLYSAHTDPTKITGSMAPHHATRTAAMIHSPDRDIMLCRYPSKLCDNIRSEKRGGGLHRFCTVHREQANINQRRVDHRRRLKKKGIPVPPTERAYASRRFDTRHSDTDLDDLVSLDVDLFDASDVTDPLLPDFSEDDLQQLISLLNDTDSIQTTGLPSPSVESTAYSSTYRPVEV